MKKLVILSLGGLLLFITFTGCTPEEKTPIAVAVEFNDHGASGYIAQDKGWFQLEGLKIETFESYVTGMALAAALSRGDIDVAYICLVPAINTYANAGVPIKIVAGTHKYGYGLVVNRDRIKTVKDLENPDIRIGCVREGGTVDIILHKTIDKYHLEENKIVDNIQRMNPPKQVMSIKMGQLDAAFLPEHWATMAEEFGFTMLLQSQDIWPGMQGSVVIVTQELLTKHPDKVTKLVNVNQKATDWILQNPEKAAETVARQLTIAAGNVSPLEVAGTVAELDTTPELVSRSMNRLEYITSIDSRVVQDMIDYLAELGYIKESFGAEDILNLM